MRERVYEVQEKVNRDVVLVLRVKFARLEMNTVLYSGH